jgi:hypothetical protein
MREKYYINYFAGIGLVLLVILSACSKQNQNGNSTSGSNLASKVTAPTPLSLGLWESDSSIYKLLYIEVPKIGTQTVNQYLVFDTGSGGMVIDGHEILPASMVTANGFNFTGDSTVVNGITITNQTGIMQYGADNATTTTAYGNLAYANVTIGDPSSGNFTVTRLPFFIYYKGTDANGKATAVGDFDVFGVNESYDLTFANNAYITSPLSYYTPATGLTKGFKMAALGSNNFSLQGTFVNNVLTLGLTSSDLSSNGFTYYSSEYYAGDGYTPVVKNAVTYNTNSFQGYVLFDTGTEPYNYLFDPAARSTAGNLLAAGSSVAVKGITNTFNWTFTTTNTDYLTYVLNPGSSGGSVSILGLEYFLNNEYAINFASHQFGVKVY